MNEEKFVASDGHSVFCYRWSNQAEPKALIHIVHGMGEHAGRYDWVAMQLVASGYHVTANDHRGHGRTARTLGDFGPDGWNRILKDLREMITDLKARYPGIPLVLFGHSMGAMLTQQFMANHGELLDAAILSGSPGAGNRFQMWLVHTIARFERWRKGACEESPLLQNLIFGSSNKAFEEEPGATGYEWLSRDPEQVRRYVDDPFCGFVPCPRSICDLFAAERQNWSPESIARIPADLPVCLFSGTDDPVHNGMKNIDRLLKRYRDRGLHIDTRFHEGGRHEMLNEINRDEVMDEVIRWLDTTIGRMKPT